MIKAEWPGGFLPQLFSFVSFNRHDMMAVDFFYRKCVAFKINGAPGLRVNMLSKKPAPSVST